MKGHTMEQSDIDLLHTVPPYHLQSLLKLRRPKGQATSALGISSTTTLDAAAQKLFQPFAIAEALHSLNDTEGLILREMVASGGGAHRRDLALSLISSQAIGANKAA